ncbi:MAG: hypothetical protein KAT34_12935 [Candidatus Aminicenantes bacterium]|nr:hypothetical protein [Candidatus Aminicenantes bacterium]
MAKCRKAKLFFNLILTAAIFTYFVLILILLLNPHISVSGFNEFLILYRHLVIYYGPLWFVVSGVIFFVIQFFSEKKYPIGIISPPTITYFLSFAILIISFILYLNYDYYFTFLAHNIRAKYIKILLSNLALILVGIVFVFFKRINKKWVQVTFLIVLAFNIINSYYSIISNGHVQAKEPKIDIFPREVPDFPEIEKSDEIGQEENLPKENPQRKIRIVFLDGLSLKLLHTLSLEEKLLNFHLLMSEGVIGRITTFKPNLNLALTNTSLTGLRASEFLSHSNHRFKFSGLHFEFEISPRYIFFRNSSILGITTFYKRNDINIIDNISKYYENNNFETTRLLNPDFKPKYAKKSLRKNSSFILRFSEILELSDKKYELLKKAFFLDDYFKNIVPNLKDSDKYYAAIRFPGLGNISRYFYQYYDPEQLFSRISEVDIKKYGMIIEKYYDYYDSIIGNLMTTTGDNELLVILSFFEFEPLPVWRRILVKLYGRKDIYVYKSLDSKGTILMYEKNALKKGYPLKDISILDIFPTLIYYAGFQLSKNLQGDVIKEIFTKEFQLNNPIDINTNYKR